MYETRATQFPADNSISNLIGFRSKCSRKLLLTISVVALGACSSGDNESDIDPDIAAGYLLSTKFQGENRVLSAVDADEQSQPIILLSTANGSSAQVWKLNLNENGEYNISNLSVGAEQSIDVVNDGVADKIQFAATDNVSGQNWNIVPLDNGYCQLKNNFTGSEIALDIINDEEDNRPILRATANVTGQQWRIVNRDGTTAVDELLMRCGGEE